MNGIVEYDRYILKINLAENLKHLGLKKKKKP